MRLEDLTNGFVKNRLSGIGRICCSLVSWLHNLLRLHSQTIHTPDWNGYIRLGHSTAFSTATPGHLDLAPLHTTFSVPRRYCTRSPPGWGTALDISLDKPLDTLAQSPLSLEPEGSRIQSLEPYDKDVLHLLLARVAVPPVLLIHVERYGPPTGA